MRGSPWPSWSAPAARGQQQELEQRWQQHSGSKSGTVGLLLPETKTTRYEAFDHPLFEKKLKELCPDCKLIYANANQDAAQQQSQAESMLTKGVDVLVLDPVDAKAAEAIVNKAKAQDVPVVAYDRLAEGPIDDYVSFDNEKVGKLQGQALLEALDKAGTTERGHDRHDQRLADRPERRRSSRRARTRCSTAR